MKKILLMLLVALPANASHQNVCRILTHVSYIVNSGESTYLPETPTRRCLMIENKGGTTILVKFGAASVGSEGISILAGNRWEAFYVPVNVVRIKSVGASATVGIVEGK